MTVLEPIHCPNCHRTNVVKHGKSAAGKQRYCCRNANCQRRSFILEFTYRGYLPEVKQQVSETAYVLAPHEDAALRQLKELLAPFSVGHFYTDAWGAYLRLLDAPSHTGGKANTQSYWAQAFNVTNSDSTIGSKNNLFFQVGIDAWHCDWNIG